MKLLVLALTMVALSGCSVVTPGKKGIRFYFGKMSPETLEQGPHLWIPFILGVKYIDTRIQKSEYKTNASSRDMQTIVTDFALNWRLDSNQVVDIYQKIGDEENALVNIIEPAMSETLKYAMAKITAEEVLTKREQLKEEVDKTIEAKMKPYGIIIESINITNVEFSHDFSQAIEAKQVAEQKAQQAKYEADRAIQDANAERNRAKGQADAQNLLKMTLSPELLKLKAIEKWDGKFPTYMGSQLPFVNFKGE